MAGGAPMPSTDIAMAISASVGMVVPRLITWVTSVRIGGECAAG